ncbi:4-hydroxyphenylpyruvate dioxygenase [bacterium]|jgi:4-hydroxyphenylpyruvate dioxygenase|nr:4-hydroxyphenylpyruvate dioxygenase [bacterium]
MANTVGIRKYDFVEFYVGSAKMAAYWFSRTLGIEIKGYLGPETGHRDRMSFYMKKGDLSFLVTSALGPETSEIQEFVSRHGDGVKRFCLEVDDVTRAFSYAVSHGAIPIRKPEMLEDEAGSTQEAAIRLYDDTELVFTNRDGYGGVFRPGFETPKFGWELSCEQPNLLYIDHIVGNVRTNEMNRWEEYFNRVLDFETFVNFGPGDITTKYSALLSKVVRSKDNLIKNPINEPFEGIRMSQIEEFIKEYRGSGIQHIAIRTENIIQTIGAMRANGVEFLQVPHTYYDSLRSRNLPIEESIDDLQELGILLDFEGDGYLLQLFTKPILDRPTFFFEIIQRHGNSQGFGQGNFQALFEAIELDQERRGNLV